MRGKYRPHHILQVVSLFIALAGFSASNSKANENSKYLDAVREFADNVLKYGRDTYGPKHTPLFVDGLNIHTLQPVKWISPEGERWILSNLASQQNLFRTLDGLTKITGDPKYRQAAMDAIRYAFDNLRAPNGLLYWGGVVAYDAHGDDICGEGRHQTLKYNYPYYELMWEVDPEVTNEFIEAFWMSNILDWSNLDMNRYSRRFDDVRSTPKGWDYEYEGGQVFFKSTGSSFFNAGSDLFYAAAILSKLSGEKEPLIWSKRLASRYIETRNPKIGISGYVYSQRETDEAQIQLGDDFKGHLVLCGTLFPSHPEFRKRTIKKIVEHVRGWICELLLGDLLGADGKEFKRWALEELVARGKAAYRKEDNSFIPMLTDGTSLEGYVFKKGGYFGPKGMVIRAWPLGPIDFWAYSLAYRMSRYEYIWEMARNIGQGSGFGDIGATPTRESRLQTDTACADPHALLGFLELYKATAENRFLEIAQRIGDNILSAKFYKGFFVPSKQHIYTRFDAPVHLALLHLHAAMKPELVEVPRVWPSCSVFLCGYRNRLREYDIYSIYRLTESPELPISLHEAATLGDINKCTLLISQGADIDVWDQGSRTPLHYAAMNGHKQVVELLLAKGSDINTENVNGSTALDVSAREGHINVVEFLIDKGAEVNVKDRIGLTPLHNAADGGHKEIVELLIAKGADVNAKNNHGQTPVDIAINRNRNDIVELLVEKGAVLPSIHEAARLGALTGVKAFLEQGVDVDAQDDEGITPLHCAVRGGHKELAEFLIAKGADVNAKTNKGLTPLTFAVRRENKDIIRILVAKGADVNLTPKNDSPPLYYAVWNKDKEMVEFFVNNGAKFDVKDRDDWTAFRYAASQGSRELVEFFVSKGADTSRFHMAACLGDLARVKNFVEQGTDVDTKDELGWTPLYWAVSTGQKEVAEFLVANGANINVEIGGNRTPLHQAAHGGERKLAELLISRGAEVDAKDRRGDTPLCNAASAGHREVVELLIAKGANVNEKNRQSQTPLYRAVQKGHKDVAEVLIDKGADINAKAGLDWTVLHIATTMGRKDIPALLIAKGADMDSKDANGQTPLHLSARQGHSEVTKLLVSEGADVNVRNRWNRTPLDLAISGGHNEIAELLRKHVEKTKDETSSTTDTPQDTPKEEAPSDPNAVSQN